MGRHETQLLSLLAERDAFHGIQPGRPGARRARHDSAFKFCVFGANGGSNYGWANCGDRFDLVVFTCVPSVICAFSTPFSDIV